MNTNIEEKEATTASTEIKRETTGDMSADKKETELCDMTDCAIVNWLCYADNKETEYETGNKIVPIRQGTQTEEAAAWDDKSGIKNEQRNSITVNVNLKWCAQEKMNNNQNSVVQKKDANNDVVHMYIEKIYEHRNKSKIIRKYGIENHKAIKTSCPIENNDPTINDTSLGKYIQDSEMNLV